MKKEELKYFEFKYNSVKPKVGRILISEPYADDLYFKRSVVLITEYSDEGTAGFVLNKPVKILGKGLLEELMAGKLNVSLGGPVATDTLHYLHTYGASVPGSKKIVDGLWHGGDLNVIKTIIESDGHDENKLRFFLGYSGWDSGQLEKELENNFWLVRGINSNDVMKIKDTYDWKNQLNGMGAIMKIWANSPDAPELN